MRWMRALFLYAVLRASSSSSSSFSSLPFSLRSRSPTLALLVNTAMDEVAGGATATATLPPWLQVKKAADKRVREFRYLNRSARSAREQARERESERARARERESE